MQKYTVEITKHDGMKSTYFIVALSAGGAETVALRQVYNAKFALAKYGWPKTVTQPDLFSDAAARQAIREVLK